MSYDGISVPASGAGSITTSMVNSQCQYALTANDQALFGVTPAGTSGPVTEERVEGAVTVKYGPSSGSTDETEDSLADSMIADFMCDAGALFGIRA